MPLPQLAAQDDALSELLQLINRQLTEKDLKVEKASAAVIDATIIQTGFSDGLLLSFLNIMNKRVINLAAAPIRTTRGAGCRFMADKNTFSDG